MEEEGIIEEISLDTEESVVNVLENVKKKSRKTVRYEDQENQNKIHLKEVSQKMQTLLSEMHNNFGSFSNSAPKNVAKKQKHKTMNVRKTECVQLLHPHHGQTLQPKYRANETETKVFYAKTPQKHLFQLLNQITRPRKRSSQQTQSVSKQICSTPRCYSANSKRDLPRIVSPIPRIPDSNNEMYRKLKSKVEWAMRAKKTFTVCGNYNAVRKAMLARGWLEKIKVVYNTIEKDTLRRLLSLSIMDLLGGVNDQKNGNLYKRAIMSKMLSTHQVDFYWDQGRDCFRVCPDTVKLTMVNRFKKGIFHYTTKQGLCETMRAAYWFQKPGIASVRYPRTYTLTNAEDPKEFVNDFKITACMSLLKYIINYTEVKPGKSIIQDDGKVPLNTFNFAVDEMTKIVRKFKQQDIDRKFGEARPYEWNNFLENFFRIVHIGLTFKNDRKITINKMLETSKSLTNALKMYWPASEVDGMYNIWILKPVNSSKGQGIHLCRTLQYVMKVIKSGTKKYIIQKYIERPLLIHNTKFDIRQWFLISNANPLTIWIYKDCYIRFSSQLYCLNRLNESIHLTNNSIQSKYKNCTNRSSELPSCNMWDSQQFREYLCKIGKPTVFDDIIYPGMKEAITAAIIMNQGSLDTRKNCFEIYGSDFMITEDFQPWLIEINSNPALFASTPVTARMCPQVLEDLIKVVIDHAKNGSAPTGRFELLYKEAHCVLPSTKSASLQLQGQKLPSSYFCNTDDRYQHNKSCYIEQEKFKEAADEIKDALLNLLTLFQAESTKKKISNYSSTGTSTAGTDSEVSSEETTSNNYCKSDSFSVKQSKSDTDIKNALPVINVRPTTGNTSIFENVIESMKNLAKVYQQYQTSQKPLKLM